MACKFGLMMGANFNYGFYYYKKFELTKESIELFIKDLSLIDKVKFMEWVKGEYLKKIENDLFISKGFYNQPLSLYLMSKATQEEVINSLYPEHKELIEWMENKLENSIWEKNNSFNQRAVQKRSSQPAKKIQLDIYRDNGDFNNLISQLQENEFIDQQMNKDEILLHFIDADRRPFTENNKLSNTMIVWTSSNINLILFIKELQKNDIIYEKNNYTNFIVNHFVNENGIEYKSDNLRKSFFLIKKDYEENNLKNLPIGFDKLQEIISNIFVSK